MENVCKTYFSTGRTPAQNPRAVFSINQLAVKYEHASRDGSLFPEKWGLSHQPSPLLCCAWCTSRAFSPGSTGMCQYVLCSVLLGDELSSPHCPTSKNVIFFFYLISLPMSHIPHHPHHSHHLSAFKASWMAAGLTGYARLSEQHLAQGMFLHKHMGFSSQIVTDKPMADD